MGAQGARGAGSAPSPRVSSPCLTHPHGGNGGGSPQLLLLTLASREAATVATAAAAKPERPWPRTAHAPRRPPARPGGHCACADAGRGLAGAGVQVESSGGGPRVSQPKEAGGAEQRRAANDVARARPLLVRLRL